MFLLQIYLLGWESDYAMPGMRIGYIMRWQQYQQQRQEIQLSAGETDTRREFEVKKMKKKKRNCC